MGLYDFPHIYTWGEPSNYDPAKHNLFHSEWLDIFDCNQWTQRFYIHWELPLIALTIYSFMLMYLPKIMEKRTEIKPKNLIFLWNVFLSTFSWCGVFFVVPHLLFGECGGGSQKYCGLLTGNLYSSICTNAQWYGHGMPGMFIMLFIFSKIPELCDTIWLLLAKKKVIFLHWYHHVSVLLYVWHSYSSYNSIGVWFAANNYCVHAVMYTYYAMTQYGPNARALAKRFAKFVTYMQISQMFVGIFLISSAAYYKYLRGAPCNVEDSNLLFGGLMYASYAVLFVQLSRNRYSSKKKSA